MAKRTSVVALASLVILTLAACTSEEVPQQTSDGWETARPSEVGLDYEKLAEAVELVDDSTYPNVHSILVVKDSKLVFENYFDGYM